VEELKYYVFMQNNSHGRFIDPATQLVIEAGSENEALNIAFDLGVYFDPEFERDCECCGTRWGYPYAEDQVPAVDDNIRQFAASDKVAAQLVIVKEDK
jgi:hypothetical protein